jgi:hypothetical protein
MMNILITVCGLLFCGILGVAVAVMHVSYTVTQKGWYLYTRMHAHIQSYPYLGGNSCDQIVN